MSPLGASDKVPLMAGRMVGEWELTSSSCHQESCQLLRDHRDVG